MFQDRPSQQVQNCPSQQRTGPAVQVAIDKTYKRRIAAVDWRIINKSTRIYRRRQRVTAVQVNKVLFLISLLSLSPPPPNGKGAVTATMRNFRLENRHRGSKRRPPERPRPKVASLEEGENREHTRKDQAENPIGKCSSRLRMRMVRHHQHPKAPLVTLTEETKHTVS